MIDEIAVYRGRQFQMEPVPEWWEAEFDRIYPESAERLPNVQRVVYGNIINRISIICWSYTRGRERLSEVEDGS